MYIVYCFSYRYILYILYTRLMSCCVHIDDDNNSKLCVQCIVDITHPTGAFNICCPRDCVSRHNGGTSGAPLKPLRVDSALRALSTLRGK